MDEFEVFEAKPFVSRLLGNILWHRLIVRSNQKLPHELI